MYPSVNAAFVPFSTAFEGSVPWMYVDQKGLVTTGIGNLIDPVENALRLPWTHGVGGPAATPEEVMAAFKKVKTQGQPGSGGGTQGGLTDLRLTEDGVHQLVGMKLTDNEQWLRQAIPQWDSLHADAQLGLLSMAWALGPGFPAGYPKFMAAINAVAPDYRTAALESWMKDTKDGWVPHSFSDDVSAHPPNANAGLRPRNLANRQLFLNAAAAQDQGIDPAELVWDVAKGLAQLGMAGLSAVADAGVVAAKAATNPWVLGAAALCMAGGLLGLAKETGELKKLSPRLDEAIDRMTGIPSIPKKRHA